MTEEATEVTRHEASPTVTRYGAMPLLLPLLLQVPLKRTPITSSLSPSPPTCGLTPVISGTAASDGVHEVR